MSDWLLYLGIFLCGGYWGVVGLMALFIFANVTADNRRAKTAKNARAYGVAKTEVAAEGNVTLGCRTG